TDPRSWRRPAHARAGAAVGSTHRRGAGRRAGDERRRDRRPARPGRGRLGGDGVVSDLPDLDALGLTETAVDTLAGDHALRLARTLDLRDDVLADGVLPLTWIWVFFSPSVASAGLRDDGHPAGDADGALAGLDRRMFIGGSL